MLTDHGYGSILDRMMMMMNEMRMMRMNEIRDE
jgi:hypothetical protein